MIEPADAGRPDRVTTADIRRLSYIDALRGYAILSVMVVHVAQYVPTLEWPLIAVAFEGARGVQLFFVASALTLMLSWHARADGVPAFYIRRVFRIAPMFWLAIALFVELHGLGPRGSAPRGIAWPHILATGLFVHGFHPETISSVVPGGSTIAVEMTFYALFPLLAVGLRSWQSAALALAASFVGAALLYPITIEIYGAFVPELPDELLKSFSFAWLPTQMPAFLIGILTYHLLRRFPQPVPCAVLDAGAAIAVALAIVLPLATTSTKILFVAYVVDFGLLAFCLGQGGGRRLVSAPMRFLGTISYSAYFWHFAVLWLADRLGLSPYIRPHYSAPGWLQFVVLLTIVLAATVVLAATTYRLIETPMIRLGRRVAAKVATRPAIALAPTPGPIGTGSASR